MPSQMERQAEVLHGKRTQRPLERYALWYLFLLANALPGYAGACDWHCAVAAFYPLAQC